MRLKLSQLRTFVLLFAVSLCSLHAPESYAWLNGVMGSGGTSTANPSDVSGLTFNSTGAAATNATAINAALAAGGQVNVNCPAGSTVYTNATLKLYSFSALYVQASCTIKPTTGVAPLLANQALFTAWTTLYDASGIITSGPLSIIRTTDTPAWAISTVYGAGVYVRNGGNVYWTAAGGTSAGSGGPTGTGSGITDNTVTWNYVTPYVTAGTIIHWPSHGQIVGNALWLTPRGDNGTDQYWSGTGAAHAIGGPADSAYFGIFPIIAVNDTNYVTVTLRRNQAAAFTGIPMLIKQADQDITVRGGIWDGNYPTNDSCTSAILCHNWHFGGVNNLVLDDAMIENQNRYELSLAGVENADVSHLFFGPKKNPFDGIKVYGPAFDVRLHDIYGASTDDWLTLHPEEGVTYRSNVVAAGDVLNIKLENIYGYSGRAIALFQANPFLITDNIDVSHVAANNMQSYVPLSIINAAGSLTNQGGIVGDVHVHDLTLPSGSAASAAVYVNFSGTTNSLQQLNIDNVNVNANGTSQATYLANLTGGVINQVNLNNNNGTTNTKQMLLAGATVGQVNMLNNSFQCNGCQMADLESGTLGSLNIENNSISGTTSAMVIDKVGPRISFRNNYIPGIVNNPLVSAYTNTNIYIANNYAPLITQGVVRSQASALTSIITSGGGNNFTASSAWFTVSSGGVTPTMYGWDIPCNVVNIARVTGSFCQNTNAAPGSGTLTTVGPIMDQGTGSLSWFALSSPTTQQY